MEEAKDTHELKAVVKLVDHAVLLLGKKLSDGFQWTDLVSMAQELASDPVLSQAVKEYKEIVPECKDLSLPEGLELFVLVVIGVPKYIEAFKKGDMPKLLA
jgi:hypothetical protein